MAETPPPRRAWELVAAAALLLMTLNLCAVAWRKNITADEFYHVAAGYHHLFDGEFRVNSEHPPLAKMLAALPLVFTDVDAPPAAIPPSANPRERTDAAVSAFWRANTARFDSVSFIARLPAVALTLALGVTVFLFARRLFGTRAAALAVLLFAFEPTLLAHGRVVHTDVPAALLYLLFFLALRAYADAPTARRATMTGVVLGLSLVTKFSLLVLLPVFLILSTTLLVIFAPRTATTRARSALHATLAVAAVLLVVNAAYYFRRPPLSHGDVAYLAAHAPERYGALVDAASALSALVPTAYTLGVYQVAVHNSNGHLASLLGRYSTRGWWHYFPVAFALKTTLPFLLLSLAALAWALPRLFRQRDRRFLWLLAPAALYAALAMSSRINIGVRHFLPVFPFLLVASGALLDRLLDAQKKRRATTTMVVLLLCWHVFEAARAYPDYIPYMNQLASRGPRWQYLTDSNVEWGDDVRALAHYLRARGETRIRGALLDGLNFNAYGLAYARALDHYGVEYVSLLAPRDDAQDDTRYVAVGASYLNGATLLAVPPAERRLVAAYRDRTPEAVFGNSIYLYRVRE